MSDARLPAGRRAMPPLDLDFESSTWTDLERAQLMRRYELYHGPGDGRLVQFVPFEIDNNPGGFKRYRQYLTQIGASMRRLGGDDPGAQERVKGLLMIHLYAATGNGSGCLYEIIGYRMHGLTKAQVREALAFAFLTGGPSHTQEVAEAVAVYLDAWHEGEDEGVAPPPIPPYPHGWKPDPDAFRSGIDVSRPGMSAADAESLKAWHRRMAGDVPAHVQLWCELHPEALKPQRARFEASIGKVLPAQIYPLMQLQHAAYMGWPAVALRAMAWAQALGVKREYAICALELTFMYGGETRMEAVLTADVAAVLKRWSA